MADVERQIELTASQRAAVEHRGGNLLLAASAGAGKTEVLARRVVSLVSALQQPCAIDRLLIVTFTRAAASELRVRVARMLRAAALAASDEKQRRHLRRQELFVDVADIGTIDAWCGRIVREHYAELGVDVDFGTLGEQDARLLRAEVLDDLMDQIHRGGDELLERARGWIGRSIPPGDGFLRDLIGGLSVFREHLVNPDDWFERQRAACECNDADAVLTAALRTECAFQHTQLRTLLAESGDAVQGALLPYFNQLGTWLPMLDGAGGLGEVVEELARFRLARPKRGESESPVVEEVRKRWLKERLQNRWKPADVDVMLRGAPLVNELGATLLELEERYHELLNVAKRQRGAYEFADVTRMALDLLGRAQGARGRVPTAIAHRLRERYEHILVDEYQDTSPIQVAVLGLVARDDAGRTNRFMVGDVKQSIYGFRQAEPRLFAELAADFAAGREEGTVSYLSDNFRSHAALLEPLNAWFELLFDRELGGTEYGVQERLQAGRQAGEIDNPTMNGSRVSVEIIEEAEYGRHSEADEDALRVDRIEREAQIAADQIIALLRGGTEIPQRGPGGTVVLRPLELRDIVVLLRSARHNAGLVARVLRNNGIACVTGGREALLDAVDVRDVCHALELLVNRRRDVPLAAYLRGPLVGLTCSELLEVRTALGGQQGDLLTAVELYRRQRPGGALAVKLDAGLSQLDRWSVFAREEELPTVVRRILQDGALPLHALGLRDGAQREALLQAVQSVAEEFGDGGGGGVAEFVEHLGALSAHELDPGALAAGGENAVRIMTIHGTKGLEFPVVLLLGAGKRFNMRSQIAALQCDEELGLGLRCVDYPARARLIGARHHVVKRSVARRELEEELRLLYVATTRAKERLHVIGHAPPDLWAGLQERYASSGHSLPLISRMSAHNLLEWVLQATAAAHLHEAAAAECGGAGGASVCVRTHEPASIQVRAVAVAPRSEAASSVPAAEDLAWIERGRQLLSADIGSPLADYPAMLSVSGAKELALREQDADRPRVIDEPVSPLAGPAFVRAGGVSDGRDYGIACHRFLELADFARIGSRGAVRGQLDALVQSGRLAERQAELVPIDDIVWLAGTPEGGLPVRYSETTGREVPFVHALPIGDTGEHTIVRGVIDCLVDTPEGLIIIDYKTDGWRGADEFDRRLAGYGVQLKLYARAAGAIFSRPVTRMALVFLCQRRIVNISPEALDLDRVLGLNAVGVGGAGESDRD